MVGAVVVGFDLSTRAWATAGERAGRLARGFPIFDGVLRTDTLARDGAADDFGHLVHRRPLAVLEPGSVDDIVRLIRFARRWGIGVAPRGQGHASYGQAQVDAGVVIDMGLLSDVHDVADATADVDAGVTWRTLLDRTLERGLTPPTLTDYQDLSIGGTLSLGGIGGAGFRYGAQVDNVVALEVVTGEGRLVRCSRSRRPHLFDAVLAGLGQCAVITRASVGLRPAPDELRVFDLVYGDLQTFAEDSRTVLRDARFDTLQGLVVPGFAGGWAYILEATSSSGRSDGELLAQLRDIRQAAVIASMSYRSFALRLDPIVEQQRQAGTWEMPHPWLAVWLPDDQAVSFAGRVLSALTVDDTGGGPILLYPTRSAPFRQPLLRTPTSELMWQFAILRTALPHTAVSADDMVQGNRRLFEQAQAVGGLQYPNGAIPLTRADWVQHFGEAWPAFVRAKRRHDPAGILTPGQDIFGYARSSAIRSNRRR